VATRASTSGKLSPSDSFPQSSYVRWTTQQYTDCCKLISTRLYHNIPASGSGSSGTNYDQTDFGYDTLDRQNRVETPGGTITFTVFDARSLPASVYVGTDDTGATDSDPTGGGAAGNNMVIVTANEYDGGNDGGDGNLTKVTESVNASTTRVTSFGYDWRDRQTSIDGEIDFYQKTYYDNLDRVTKVERYDTTSSGNLIGRQETKFDDLSRTYESVNYGVNPSTGSVGNSLTDETWYDAAGNVLKQAPSGSKLFTKSVYDGLNRETKSYVGYDVSETSYAEAGTITGDTILEQTETTYDDASNVIQTTTRQRYHNATGTGELKGPTGTEPKARVTYVASWPDGVGRDRASADYGTNGGISLSRPSTIPSRADTVLVSSNEYDDTGELESSTDPAGMQTKFEYDDAGRQTKTIENYQPAGSSSSSSSSSSSGDPCPPSDDTNRTTVTTYNADGNTATLTAWNADTGNQTTTYVYGTTLTDSDVAASTLLRRVKYPDSTGDSDSVEYEYNRQAEHRELKDQRGCIHTFDFDKLGRLTEDRVTTLGTGVDGAVRRLSASYEVRGLPDQFTSHDNATVNSGTVVNQLQFTHNDFGQTTTSYQAHGGAVNTSISPKVQYGYANGSANTIRPTWLRYPDGRIINYDYGTSGGNDDAASRIKSLKDGPLPLVDYQYLGLSSIVEVDYTVPDVRYRLYDGAASGNIYTGLDRFGRVIDSHWYDYGASTDAARIKYGYDRASNRIWREDTVADAQSKPFDELYQHDGLHRLKDMQRGTLNSQHSTINSLQFQQCWSLDETGNWSGFRSDDDGTSGWNLVQNRTSNTVNEITNITETTGPSWTTPAYDPAGNMTTVPQPADPTTSYTATYDAWNRLVKLIDGANTVQENEYDPRKFRTVRKDFAAGALNETRHFYYTNGWQSIEERVDISTDPERQHIWGLRYIDDLVLRDRDTTGNGTLDERLYCLQDANWNVTAVTDENGDVQERYAYSAYGVPSFLSPTFAARNSSNFNWDTLYAGYEWNAVSNLYAVRYRFYHSLLGVWAQQDPFGYEGGVNLYRYVNSAPTNITDPLGLLPPPSRGILIRQHIQADLAEFCKDLAQKIRNYEKEIEKRVRGLREDRLKLPESCPGDTTKPRLSKRGHRRLLKDVEKRLIDALEKYFSKCGGDDPRVKPDPIIPYPPPIPIVIPRTPPVTRPPRVPKPRVPKPRVPKPSAGIRFLRAAKLVSAVFLAFIVPLGKYDHHFTDPNDPLAGRRGA
jgi:RHS repeat-associated protein